MMQREVIIIEDDDEGKGQQSCSLSRLTNLYQNLWGNDDFIDFALTSTELVRYCQKLFEIDEEHEKIVRNRLVFQKRFINSIEQFKCALPHERDEICEEIYFTKSNTKHFQPDHFQIFNQCLESENVQLMKSTFQQITFDIQSHEHLEKLLWIILCEHTYQISIFKCPEIISYRILPSFVGGTLQNRAMLCEYLQFICTSIETHNTIPEISSKFSKFSPILNLESGVWFCRIVFEYMKANSTTIDVRQRNAWIVEVKNNCPEKIVAREATRYGIVDLNVW
jgi:hypothetical protein